MPKVELSNPEKLKLVTWRGNTIKLTVILKDSGGDAIDLSDYDFLMTVYKGTYSDTLFTIVPVNAGDDLSTVFSKTAQDIDDATKAGCYNYRIDAENATGTFTILYGEFEIL